MHDFADRPKIICSTWDEYHKRMWMQINGSDNTHFTREALIKRLGAKLGNKEPTIEEKLEHYVKHGGPENFKLTHKVDHGWWSQPLPTGNLLVGC